jgi:alcohol dehydrogenase
MKAWRLDMAAATFAFDEVPDPPAQRGSVRVRVEATQLVSYLRDYVAGRLDFYNPPTGVFTPGTSGIGTIAEVGDDVYGLEVGQRVVLTGHYTAAENVDTPAEALLGITAQPQFVPVLDAWPDGTFAEQVVVPASTVTPVPAALDGVASSRLAAVTRHLVPYGGLLRGGLAPGETVLVNAATGNFGAAAIPVALAMGAARVVAAGRNQDALNRLAAADDRVTTVALTGDVAADTDSLRAAGDGHIDLALDLVGGAATPDSTLAALQALRPSGRLVLMGSSAAPPPIDYTQLMITNKEIIGNFMYPRWAPGRLLAMVAAGILDLDRTDISTHPLADLETAMDEAAQPGAALVVVEPDTVAR